MKKADFVSLVAEQSGMTKKDTEACVEVIFRTLGDVLAQGERVTLTGFGTFDTKQRGERTVCIPNSAEKASVPAARVPVFRPAKQLKEKLNPKTSH
ncbi:MAG: HU family DNA-binding protein [Clostridiales bacterium]|nr:HU family DNA-binding protein [Clostridiales bacterium]